MDKFLEKIQMDMQNKILHCVSGKSIIKPFDKVFEEVRTNNKKTKKQKINNSEESIYNEIIKKFLEENPEFIKG